jgi:pilus assembly protein CpaC
MLLAALAAIVGGTATAQPQNPAAGNPPASAGDTQPTPKAPDVKVGKNGELLVPLGGTVRFKPNVKVPFNNVFAENETIVKPRNDATDASILLLDGLAGGVTRIVLTLVDGSKGEYEVVVQPDYELLKRVIAKAVPTASIEVIPGVGGSIVLSGYVNRPEDAETVMLIARAASGGGGAAPTGGGAQSGGGVINAIQVGGLQHVQIEVVFASVNRSKIRERAVGLNIIGTQGSLISAFGSPNTNITAAIVPAGFTAAITALKGENLTKILSEPKIVTQSGRPATLFSGGEQATIGQSGGGLQGTTVERVRVGTTLNVIPIVYGNGKIYLELSPTFQSVDFSRGIPVSTPNGQTVTTPGFNVQTANASVMLESGQTFAIGGLLQNDMQITSTKLPVLGEIPYLGAVFSNSRYQENETELIILVTPRLVDALDCGQVPKRVPGRETRSPDDYEFYLECLLEAPRGQRQVWNGRCYQAAYKCDPTYGIFPCKGNVCAGGNCNSGVYQAGGCANGNCNVPTTLPAPVTATPNLMPTPNLAPANAPAALSVPHTTMAPVAPVTEPVIMPQQTPVTPAPSTPVSTPVEPPSPLVAPVTVQEPAPVPGPVTEAPASPPVTPPENK